VRRDLRARYLGISAALVGAVWCLAALASYLDIALPAGTWIVCLALTIAIPVIAFALATLRSPSIRRAAVMLDERLDNKQRLVTAMELVDAGPLPPVSQAQVATSARMLASADPDIVYPMRSSVAHYSLGAGLLSVALGLFFLKAVGGNFTPVTAGNQPVGSSTSVAMTSPTPQSGLPNSNAQQDQPTPAGGTVQLGVDPQDAARKAEESQKAQNALDRLKSALDEQSATQGAADSLRQGNYDDAANKLGDLGSQNDQLSDAAKQGISDALKRAANDSGSTPDLQNSERNAANALDSGDYNATAQALKDLGDAIKSTAQQVVPQQQLAQGFPQQGQDSGQSGQDQQQSQQGQQSGQGQGQSGDQSQQNGQGQGQDSSGNNANGNGQQGQGQGQNGQGQDQQGGQGQGQNGGGSDNSQAQAEGQNGGAGKGDSKVSGPNDYTPRNVQGDPFELQGKGDPSQPNSGDPNSQNQPGISLQGSTGDSSQALPPEQGGPVTAPSESNQVPVERWGIIQKYFSHEK